MATNLLISYWDIPRRATILTATTALAGFPEDNVSTGGRGLLYKTNSTAVIQTTVDFDLGTGITAQPDHVIVTRADLTVLKDSASTDFTLSGDDNSSFTSPENQTVAVSSAGLIGPSSEDVLLETTFATAYRYWRFTIDTTASRRHEVSNVYFGNFLDMGRDPTRGSSFVRKMKQKTDRKGGWYGRLIWDGVSSTNLETFFDNVAKYRDVAPVFFYDQNDYVFGTDSLVQAWIASIEVSKLSRNTTQLSVEFEEAL